jgi:ATP-dependent DNA helicase RecG
MYLPGIGPRKADVLKREAGISSFEDMLHYFPFKYIDRRKINKISDIRSFTEQARTDAGMPYIQLKGKIVNFKTVGEGYKRRMTATFADDTGTVDLVWFKNIKAVSNAYKVETEYILFGKPALFNGRINIAHPELETENRFFGGEAGIQGQYTTTEAMKNAFLHSRAIQKIIISILEQMKEPVAETLTTEVIRSAHTISLDEAIRNIHFPTSATALDRAEYRLKFEELFFLQLNILQVTKFSEKRIGGFRFTTVGHCFNTFYRKNLPFELTDAQKRVVREIRADMNSGRQMNRLLQGDVGSGKTLVALLSALIAVDSGYQTAIMAPTEILSQQHYSTVTQLLKGIGVNVCLLTGSTKKKERETLLTALAAGEIHILIGTHALIESNVVFSRLGLVIIDEQHRFGVEQRSRLRDKNETPPHVLVMTATPIPRTLAMTFYGDLDVSIIDQLPPGRKPVKTIHISSSNRENLCRSVRRQLQQGRQIYIVYPMIEESSKMDLKNLTDGFETTKKTYPEYRVSMIHGKMKPAEKNGEMQRFVSGETQILVATTVIEVGVNVPNATVMMIENAERFGLSQLHQLRGRTGRGASQSFCILLTDGEPSENARRRIEIMTETNDGFLIAEEDLKMNGPGDIDGTQQRGIPFNLKIAKLSHDGQILNIARDIATGILEHDPTLTKEENAPLNSHLQKMKKQKKAGWFMIS